MLKNKQLMITLAIILIAIVVGVSVVLAIYFTRERGSGIMPYEYAPADTFVYAQFSTGVNMGDVTNNILPLVSSSLPVVPQEVLSLIKDLPDLSFLNLSGFVTYRNDGLLIGIGLSHRTNSEKALDSIIEYLKKHEITAKKSENGIVELSNKNMSGSMLAMKLESDYLLIGSPGSNPESSARKTIEAALLSKKDGKGIQTLKEWDEIVDAMGGKTSNLGFYLTDRKNENPVKIAGKLYSQDGESGIDAQLIGSVASEIEKMDPLYGDSIKAMLAGQAPLDGLRSSVSNGVIQAAISAGLGASKIGTEELNDKETALSFVNGKTALWVDVDAESSKTSFGISTIASVQNIKSFLEFLFPQDRYLRKNEKGIFSVWETMVGEDGKKVESLEPVSYMKFEDAGNGNQKLVISSEKDGLVRFTKEQPAKTTEKCVVDVGINIDKLPIDNNLGIKEALNMLKPIDLKIGAKSFVKNDRLHARVFVTYDENKVRSILNK